MAIEVAAADAARIHPGIRLLDPSEWPDERADDAGPTRATIHVVEPDGAFVDESVTVIRRADAR